MGKQKGEAARSKNRPSSSSMAASLLSSGSPATAGFGGYVGSSRLDFASVSGEGSVLDSVDGELALHMKRLARKDHTTKLKALQCLSIMFSEKTKSEVVSFLPQWAFEYKRLVMDNSWEVRRATSETMSSLVVAVGRELAPHLKSVMGPWWFSQFDPYSEVSAAAKLSFQNAFPAQEKRLDALVLCTSDIFQYLEENLKLIGVSEKNSSHETDEMLLQVISSSILALASLVEVIASLHSPNASKSKLIALNASKALFTSHKCFTNFIKSPHSAVRSASYSLLKSFIIKVPDAFDEDSLKLISPEILGAFHEKDPSCHPSMWETLVIFSKQFPSSWMSLNPQKIVFNRLFHFLKNGCFGSPLVSYPALVVFLATIPSNVVNADKFFVDFFYSLWEGRKFSFKSPSHYEVFFLSFQECLSWTLDNASRYYNESDRVRKFRTNLTSNVLLKLLWNEYCADFKDGVSHELGKCIRDILCNIHRISCELLSVFCSSFETAVLEELSKSGRSEPLVNFVLILGQHVSRNEQSWQFTYIISPMLEKAFPLIKSTNSTYGIKILSVVVSTFGSRNVISLNGKGSESFKEIFVPWCLNTDGTSSSARVDLLIELLDDDETFSLRWNSILSFLIGSSRSELRVDSLDSGKLRLLCGLLEKASAVGWDLQRWRNDLLDCLVVVVTHSSSQFGNLSAHLVISAISFLSDSSKNEVFKKILEILTVLLSESSFSSFSNAACLLGFELGSKKEGIESTHFALDVIYRRFSTFVTAEMESQFVTSILALVFILKWETSLVTAFGNERSQTPMRSDILDNMQTNFVAIDKKLWKTADVAIRMKLGTFLVTFIRSVLFNVLHTAVGSLSCSWTLDVFQCLCENQEDEQRLLEQLLSRDQSWPVWIVKDYDASEPTPGSFQFVSFLDKLVREIGFKKFFGASRAWLAAEILCAWEWPEGRASESFLPYLIDTSRNEDSSVSETFSDSIIDMLINGALVHGESYKHVPFLMESNSTDIGKIEEPFLRAFVSLLSTLLRENLWGRNKAVALLHFFKEKLFVGEVVNVSCLKILPRVLIVLVRHLLPKNDDSDEMRDLIIDWLQRCLEFPPLLTWNAEERNEDWFLLVFACYPISKAGDGKLLMMERSVSVQEKELILELFVKQRVSNFPATSDGNPIISYLLSNLAVLVVGYCWEELSEIDWEFFFSRLRSWIQSAVVKFEEITEKIDENAPAVTLDGNFAPITNYFLVNIVINGLASLKFSIQNHLIDKHIHPSFDRIIEGVLRIFFCTGIAECLAKSYSSEAANLIAASRLRSALFWELVSSIVVSSSVDSREKTLKSLEFWGLSKGPISALYAILFSPIPFPSLQSAAYSLLSSHPVSQLCIIEEKDESEQQNVEAIKEKKICLKEELSLMIQNLPHDLLDSEFLSHHRVSVFLSWSLLLTHLNSLPSLSSAKDRLVQFVQESTNPVIVDCIVQHIPLELFSSNGAKKKDADLPPEALAASSSAARAIKSGSTSFAVESLWPCGNETLASLAGALYGIMLCVLPSYVREWFTDLRDRSASIQVELFTRNWCSPPLIARELSQIKKADFADENFSVSVSKSANEVVATYTKDETGMDLLIRFPASYPLRWLDVDCTRSLGTSDVKQRKWLMSLIMLVRNQNGALAEAIRMWKTNFDREFEGMEECPICYSVIHASDHSHPRLACKTCKHKYHSVCLYKWFSTSHKSSCPLCQSPF